MTDSWAAGRYLSPEPMLEDPDFVRERAQEGRSLPTYAYASNNPLNRVDPDGLIDITIPNGPTINWPDPAVPLLPAATVVFFPPVYCYYNPTAFGCSVVAMPSQCQINAIENKCNKISSDFVRECRKECTKRTGLFKACALACKFEGKLIRASCLAGNAHPGLPEGI